MLLGRRRRGKREGKERKERGGKKKEKKLSTNPLPKKIHVHRERI